MKVKAITSRGYDWTELPDVMVCIQLDDEHKIRNRRRAFREIRKIIRQDWKSGAEYQVVLKVKDDSPRPTAGTGEKQ